MRQSIKRKKGKIKNDKVLGFVTLFVFAPIVAILIGGALVRYIILPQFSLNENIGVIKEQKSEVIGDITDGGLITEGDSENSQDQNNEGNSNVDEEKELKLEGNTLYNIQVGSLSTEENAQALIEELKQQSIAAYIVKTDNYKVYTGTYFTKEEAEVYITEIREKYKDAFISNVLVEGKKVKYLAADEAKAEVITSLIETLSNSYAEETSLWSNALAKGDAKFLIEVMDNNTNNISSLMGKMKGNINSKEILGIFNVLEVEVATRKNIISQLELNDTGKITELYRDFNKSLFNFINVIRQ